MKFALQFCFLLASAATALQAQTSPARLDISSPQSRLIAGEQIQLTAVARDANGRVLRAARFSWGSDNDGILQVDSRGRVTAAGLGIARIHAETQGVHSQIMLQVLPLRVDLTPAKAELSVGETLQFRAVAYDIKESPIPNAVFEWRVTGAHGFDTNIAWVTEDGLLTATALGSLTVRAVIHYDYGFEVDQFEGLAGVDIKLPKEFQLTRLLSSGDVRHSFQLRPSHHWQIAVNDAGQVAFVGSLDGMATSLLLYENDRFDLLVSGGTPLASSQQPGGLIGYFLSPAINNRGQVLAYVEGFREPGGLMLADRSGSSLVVPWRTPIGGAMVLEESRITPHSLNDSGEALFRARISSADFSAVVDSIPALFRLSNGSLEFVWSTAAPLPGLADPIDFQDFGIDGQGTAYFLIFDASKNALYRLSRSSQPEKIIGAGDEFGGSTVGRIGVGDAGSLAVAENGDVAFSVHLENGGQHVVWISRGQMESLPVRNLGRVFAVSNAAGVLFEGNAGRGGSARQALGRRHGHCGSFIPQRHYRVDLRGSPRWNVACQQGRAQKRRGRD